MRRLLAAMILALLIYAAFTVWSGYREIASRLSEFSWSSFAAACALALGNYLLRFFKWEYYLRRLQIRGVPKTDSLLIFLSGFVLSVTPGKVGEVFKSLLLFQTHKVPIQRTAPIVVADRLTDTIGVTLLIAVGLKGLAFRGALTWALIGAGLVLACMIVIMSRALSEASIKLVERLPGPFRRLGPKIRESWESLRVMTSPGALIIPAVLSVGAWAFEGIALCAILRGFGSSLPMLTSVFFYSTATLAGGVIPVPGGLGVTESALNGQLMMLGGVDQAVATASMILVRFATLWFAVLIGFVALAVLRLLHPELRASPEGDQGAPK
ncbi:MAG: flippase-like domain-containing protein [Deltaproteobacteria bacterium]|nr:flippase-like domain-containing protein [Deltaproteobacteria bacterium]